MYLNPAPLHTFQNVLPLRRIKRTWLRPWLTNSQTGPKQATISVGILPRGDHGNGQARTEQEKRRKSGSIVGLEYYEVTGADYPCLLMLCSVRTAWSSSVAPSLITSSSFDPILVRRDYHPSWMLWPVTTSSCAPRSYGNCDEMRTNATSFTVSGTRQSGFTIKTKWQRTSFFWTFYTSPSRRRTSTGSPFESGLDPNC